MVHSLLSKSSSEQPKESLSSKEDQDISPELQTTLQRIADDVVKHLGFYGAMIATLEPDNTLPVRAYSVDLNKEMIKFWEEKLGVNFIGPKSVAYLNDKSFKDNLSVRAVKGTDGRPKEYIVSEELHDLFRPVVPKPLSIAAQKFAGIKQVIAVPFFLEDEVVGNLFAAARQEFSDRDIDFLIAFGRQAATAIQSQRHLAETQALERIILDLQASMTDEEEVLQIIVDAVVQKLGYYGAMVATLEPNNTLPVRAYSIDLNPEMIKFWEEKLGVSAIGPKSVSYLDDRKFKDNLSVRAVKGSEGRPEIVVSDRLHDQADTGLEAEKRWSPEIVVSDQLHDLFRPVVPRPLSIAAQKFAGIKQVIAVPFFIEDEIVGNLFVATRKPEFSERDKEVLRFFGQQAAAGIRNARLYQQVQSLQKDIARAYREEKDRRVSDEKLARMATFVTNIRHDLRSELGKLQYYAGRVQKFNDELPPPVVDFLNKIMNKAEVAIDLVKRLKQPTQAPQFMTRNVNEHITEAIATADRLIDRPNINVIRNLSDEEISVQTIDDLTEVFRILFNNAVDAMGEFGTITISSQLMDGEWAKVSVSDTGPGVPPERRTEIFEENFTTKEGGLGYGLFYARTALIWMDGTIQLAEEDTAKTGATFVVRLPAVDPNQPHS